jgi:hypothetical protein
LDWVEGFAWISSALLALTSGLLVVINERRIQTILLAFQYLGVAWLSGLVLPVPVAAVKFVAGILACLILAVSYIGYADPAGSEFEPRGALPSGRIFRLVAVALVITAAWGLGRSNWMELPNLRSEAIQGGTFLLALGVLQLGLFIDPSGVGFGLLTLLSGFEIVYSALEPSLAVVALLAMIHLGIAIVVGYLLMLQRRERPLEDTA